MERRVWAASRSSFVWGGVGGDIVFGGVGWVS